MTLPASISYEDACHVAGADLINECHLKDFPPIAVLDTTEFDKSMNMLKIMQDEFIWNQACAYMLRSIAKTLEHPIETKIVNVKQFMKIFREHLLKYPYPTYQEYKNNPDA